jgi:ion channel-forming bestrophin family protein
MLRNEPGIYYEDLYPLIAFLPRYAYASDGTDPNDLLPLWQASHNKKVAPLKRVETRSSSLMTSLEDVDERTWSISYRPRGYHEFYPEKVLPVVYTDFPLRSSRLPPQSGFFDYFPILRPTKRILRFFKPKAIVSDEDESFIESRSRNFDYLVRHKGEPVESNVPLQIMLYINSYNAYLQRTNLLSAPAGAALTSTINALQDAISGLDRIKSTPLPFAYQAHLRLTVWYESSSHLLRCEWTQLRYLLQALSLFPSCTLYCDCDVRAAFCSHRHSSSKSWVQWAT